MWYLSGNDRVNIDVGVDAVGHVLLFAFSRTFFACAERNAKHLRCLQNQSNRNSGLALFSVNDPLAAYAHLLCQGFLVEAKRGSAFSDDGSEVCRCAYAHNQLLFVKSAMGDNTGSRQ
jgi:hypothetical protein